MKKFIWLACVPACLIVASCSKNQAPVPQQMPARAKQITGAPTGGMQGVLPTGTYKFLAYESTVGTAVNKYVGVVGGSTAAGALIEQRDFAGSVQEWRITQTGFGTYSVVNYHSGLAIEDKNGAQTENNPIQQNNFSGSAAQEWIIEYEGLGVYRFKSLVNTNMGMHVAGGSIANGADMVLETFTAGTNQGWSYFYAYAMPISATPITLHTPDASHTDSYPRITRLANGNLLASFQMESTTGAANVIKFYKSTDGGATWAALSTLTDTHRGQGLWDATPIVTSAAVGSLPAGSLLCPVRSQISIYVGYIDVYKSDDSGATWSYYNTVASGMGAGSNVYEPFIVVDNANQLICYYSDERSSGTHSQKLVYQYCGDGTTWSSVVHDVVALPTVSARPGMFQACKMGNGKWIMSYEYVGGPNPSQVYYKTSTDGVTWDSAVSSPGTGISTISGEAPGGTPSILWTPAGSVNGTVIVTSLFDTPANSRGSSNIINTQYNTGNWISVPQPITYSSAGGTVSGYSRSVGLSADGKTLYHICCVATNGANAAVKFVATPAW